MKWSIQNYGQLPSTQDAVRESAENGAEEGLAVQAMMQSGGKGRRGNVWQSPMGSLYLSFLLRPSATPDQAGQISFLVALAVADCLSQFMDTAQHEVRLKWPNDVLVDGLKISGILLEGMIDPNTADLKGVIVGLGINIFQKPDFAVCLNDVASQPVYINPVRDAFLKSMAERYEQWQQTGFQTAQADWMARAYGLGQAMTARLPREEIRGIFEGIDETGALLLRPENTDELRVIHAGEVYFS